METGLWRTRGAAGMVDCRPEGSEGGSLNFPSKDVEQVQLSEGNGGRESR